MYKIFTWYWKLGTWPFKIVPPYYRWLWRDPGKKALLLLGISTINIIFQYKALVKWQNRIQENELRVAAQQTNLEEENV